MRFVVLLGSPRGRESASRRMARYAETVSQAEFRYIDVGRDARSPEESQQRLDASLAEIAAADAVIWAFPAYSFFLPAKMAVFLEAVVEGRHHPVLAGKPTIALMTSVRLADDYVLHQLRRYGEKLDMNWVGDYSAPGSPYFGYHDNETLGRFFEPGHVVEQGIARLIGQLEDVVARGLVLPRRHARLAEGELDYRPPGAAADWPLPDAAGSKSGKTCVLLVHERTPQVEVLLAWLQRATRFEVSVEDLTAIEIRGCLGCYLCEQEGRGECPLADEAFGLFERMVNTDALVVVSEHQGFHVHPRLKTALDRMWSFAHREMLSGRYALPVVLGPAAERHKVADYLERYLGFAGCFLLPSLVWDRGTTPEQLLWSLQRFDRAVHEQSFLPRQFGVVAARLMLRDYVYRARQGLPLDFEHFRKRGMFDFPNISLADRAWREILRRLMSRRGLRQKLLWGRRRQLGLHHWPDFGPPDDSV